MDEPISEWWKRKKREFKFEMEFSIWRSWAEIKKYKTFSERLIRILKNLGYGFGIPYRFSFSVICIVPMSFMWNAYFYKIDENPLPKTTLKQIVHWLKLSPALVVVSALGITTAVLSLFLASFFYYVIIHLILYLVTIEEWWSSYWCCYYW